MSMKASTGIVLNIYEAQIDPKVCDISKINATVVVIHGGIKLSTTTSSEFDCFPRWNQTFHLEKQCEALNLSLFHKPLLLKKVKIGSCTLPLSNQNGWVHLFNDKRRVGSLKVGISNEISPLIHNEVSELYLKKLQEVQKLKQEAQLYKIKYSKEKQESSLKHNSSQIAELIQNLKSAQEVYKGLRDEIAEKKVYLKEEEENILREKENLAKAKEAVEEEEKELKQLKGMLMRDFNEVQQTRNKLSVQERIFKNAHKTSKSEGRSPSIPNSPCSKAQDSPFTTSTSNFII